MSLRELADFGHYYEDEDLLEADNALELMFGALVSFKLDDAARETYEAMLLIRQYKIRINLLHKRLGGLWGMVGRIESGDQTKKGLALPLCEYRTGLRITLEKFRSEPGRNIPIYNKIDSKKEGRERIIASDLEEEDAIIFAYEYANHQTLESGH